MQLHYSGKNLPTTVYNFSRINRQNVQSGTKESSIRLKKKKKRIKFFLSYVPFGR